MRRILVVLCLAFCAGCAPQAPSINPVDLPPGNAATGETIFHNAVGSLQACSQCHSLDGTRAMGPSLQGFGETVKSRPDGDNPALYTMNSIINPGAYVVSGYSNLMPPAYSQLLSRQQLSDLIAYLLTL